GVPPSAAVGVVVGSSETTWWGVTNCRSHTACRSDMIKERRGIAAFTGVAKVDGDVVCSAELKCARREF
ncbi:hypothetical protein K6U59_01455, partial [Vibrio vulnificus]|nr:hypothetical protein [Vibrio vulnificus]